MNLLPLRLSAHASAVLLCLSASLPLVAQAAPTSFFVPYLGAGNLSVFDATAGSGGGVGAIDQTPDVGVLTPLSLVSVVLFNFNSATQALSGTFEFSTTDLASTLFGLVSGSSFDVDILNSGGQFSVDYQIVGGSGAFTGASGFGLSFVDYKPGGTFNNYAESGLLNFNLPAAAVPEPAGWALVALGLGLAAAARRSPSSSTSSAGAR